MLKINKYNEKIVNELSNEFDLIKTNKLQNIYKYVFSNVENANNIVKNQKFISTKITQNNFKHCEFLNIESEYFPNRIRTYILTQNTNNIFHISKNINDHIFNIYIISYESFSNKKIEDYLKNIFILLTFLTNIKKNLCFKSLNIYIYLTPFKKLLPNKDGCILGSSNVNTGVTRPCIENSIILIYRKEEWFKLLIHECIHAFSIDFSSIKHLTVKEKLKHIFYIKSNFIINETYCEVCARLINNAFISYNLLNKNIQLSSSEKESEFIDLYNKLNNIERFYSIHQLVVILNYYKIKYNELISQNKNTKEKVFNIYNEKSNIFCYYVLTAILLNNFSDFFLWCNIHNNHLFDFNKKQNITNLFIELILKNHNKKTLLKIINYLNNKKLTNKSLTMTCLGLY